MVYSASKHGRKGPGGKSRAMGHRGGGGKGQKITHLRSGQQRLVLGEQQGSALPTGKAPTVPQRNYVVPFSEHNYEVSP